MKLDYFNIIKEGKKVNINNINFSTLLNESLLDVRQKNASNLSDEEFKYLISSAYNGDASAPDGLSVMDDTPFQAMPFGYVPPIA